MDKKQIVEELAKNKIVEEIVHNITKGSTEDLLNDLIQDIYISLLEKDEAILIKLKQTNAFNFYITRMVINNIFSQNSPYYTKYKKYIKLSSELDYD